MSNININIDLHPAVITAAAEQLGFRVTYDHTPNADAWTLSTGHGGSLQEFTGTRATVCAFIAGCAEFSAKASAAICELDLAHHRLILDANRKIGRP
jgi:hypothetical protein